MLEMPLFQLQNFLKIGQEYLSEIADTVPELYALRPCVPRFKRSDWAVGYTEIFFGTYQYYGVLFLGCRLTSE